MSADDTERCSVWVDTASTTGVGWFRIADDTTRGFATEIVMALTVPAEIMPARATNTDLMRMLKRRGPV